MKKIILFILIVIVAILFTSCSTQQRVVYGDCNCNTIGFGVGMGWSGNPYWGWNDPFWGWNRWGWNDPFWGGGNQIVIIPQRFRQVQPNRYDRRVITQPSRGRVVTPTRYRRPVQPTNRNIDNVYPRRTITTPQYRTNESSNQQRRVSTPIQPQRSYTPPRTTPTRTTPQRSYTPSRTTPMRTTPQRSSTPPGRGGRGGN